jgi:hypothetical protein
MRELARIHLPFPFPRRAGAARPHGLSPTGRLRRKRRDEFERVAQPFVAAKNVLVARTP